MNKDNLTKECFCEVLNRLARKEAKNKLTNICIEDTPLWWFFKDTFIIGPPPCFYSTDQIVNKINQNKRITLSERIKMEMFAKTYIFLIKSNEIVKYCFSKLKNNNLKISEVIFITYSNHMLPNSKQRFERISTILEKIDSKIKSKVVIIDPFSRNSALKIIKFESTIYDFIDQEVIEKAKLNTKLIMKELKKIKNSELEEIFKIGPFNLWPYLKYQFNFFFSKSWISLIVLYYESFKKMIAVSEAKLIVMTSEIGLFEKCAVAAANQLRVKSLIIPHGTSFSDALNIRLDGFSNTKFALFGQEQKDHYMSRGIPEKNIVITGPVIYEEILKFRKKNNSQNRNVLFLTQAMVEKRKMTKEVYFNKIKDILLKIKLANVDFLTIKLHPLEKHGHKYANLCSEVGLTNTKIIKESRKEELYQLINDNDLVLSLETGAIIECLMLNKPLICMLLTGSKLREQPKFMITLDSEVDLAVKINMLFDDFDLRLQLAEERKLFIDNYCYGADGKASERVASYVKDLISMD